MPSPFLWYDMNRYQIERMIGKAVEYLLLAIVFGGIGFMLAWRG